LTSIDYDDIFRERFNNHYPSLLGKVHLVNFIKFFRAAAVKTLLAMVVILTLLPNPAYPLDSEDSQIFIAGFNSYQKRDFQSAIEKMSTLLKKYPDTPLRDMAIFWLARASFMAGSRQEAAKYMAQFFKEYPDSPLKATVEDELASLAAKYAAGEPLPGGEKGVTEKLARQKAEEEKAAAVRKTEELRLEAERAAAEKAAAEKAAAEKAAVKAVAEKLARDAEAEQAAARKADVLRPAAAKAVAETAQEKSAAEKAAPLKVAGEESQPERAAIGGKALTTNVAAAPVKEKATAKRKGKTTKTARAGSLREKALAEYKAVIDRYPGTAAAATASAKLKQLGVVYPAPLGVSAASSPAESASILSLEVGQHVDFDFTVVPPAQPLEAGKRVTIPLEVVNLGNGPDSFYLESGFPADYNLQFAAAARPELPLNVTPQLAAGEKFRAVAAITVPRSVIDGQKAGYPIKVGSRFASDVSQSKELRLQLSAPLLRAVIKVDKSRLLPEEKVSYRLDLLNIGTSAARGITLRLDYPPQYEPVNFTAAGFRQEMKGALVLDGVQLNSGESREFTATFQLKDEALAQQELLLRADVINTELEKRDSFLSPAAFVQSVSGVTVRTSSDKLVVIPGQTVAIPLIVSNSGNLREEFVIKPVIPGNAVYSFYQDLNRDGKKQENEPVITHVGPLAPREEAYVVLEVKTPLNENDGSGVTLALGFEPAGDKGKSASLKLQLVYSRPVVELIMTGKGGKLKPGEVSSFELDCVNRGSNMAKLVDVQSVLPGQLQLVSADPAFNRESDGVYLWRFEGLGAGEKRSIKITYKVKSGTAVGTSMQVKNILKYQDLLGNGY
jgi:uncharacterized membrane protein